MFKLEFETDNEAFGTDTAAETNHLLQEVAGSIRAGYTKGLVRDSNGNRIGRYELTQPEEEE